MSGETLIVARSSAIKVIFIIRPLTNPPSSAAASTLNDNDDDVIICEKVKYAISRMKYSNNDNRVLGDMLLILTPSLVK